MTPAAAGTGFKGLLDEIAGYADFLRLAGQVRLQGGLFRQTDLNQQERKLVTGFLSTTHFNTEFVTRLLYAAVCFHFEEFVRNLFCAIVDHVQETKQPSGALVGHNVRSIGQLLALYGTSRTHLEVDPSALAKDLQAVMSADPKLGLNARAMLFLFQSPSTANVTKLFEEVGLNISWEELGAAAEVRTAFGDESAKQNGARLEAEISGLVKNRNRLVHEGGREIVITPQDLDRVIRLMKALCTAMPKILQRKL